MKDSCLSSKQQSGVDHSAKARGCAPSARGWHLPALTGGRDWWARLVDMNPVRLLHVSAAGLCVGAFAAPVAAGATTLRGKTDQSQPVSLRITQSKSQLRFRAVVFLTRCHGSGWRHSDSGAPRAVVLRPDRRLRLDRSGHAQTVYRVRRHPHHMVEGFLNDLRWSSRVTFAASIGRGGAASGTVRFQTSVREAIDTTEQIERNRFQCDTGTRHWHVPTLSFFGPWRPTGGMIAPTAAATSVTLQDGRTLLAGGLLARERAGAVAQVYDPRSNRWQRAGRLHTARSNAAGAALADGRVLVAGGAGRVGEPIRSVEIYDPARRRWTFGPPMPFAYLAPAVARLPDGRVLVAGGFSGVDFTPTAPGETEIFDPGSNRWSKGASLPGATGPSYGGSGRPSATLLPSGQVLVVDGPEVGTYTVSDPRADTWSPRRPIPGIRTEFERNPTRLTRLSDGSVLAVGDCDSFVSLAPAAVYTAGDWHPVTSAPRCGGSLVALPSGRALIAHADGASIYDPSTNSWQDAPNYFFPHSGTNTSEVTIVPAPQGALLFSRGVNRFSSAERFFEP
jgi:Kelch motif protein